MNVEGAPVRRTPRGYWVIPAMILLFGLPYVVSYWWFFIGEVPQVSTNNRGVLLQPKLELPKSNLSAINGTEIDTGELRGQWILLSFGGSDCDNSCQDTLFTMRQVRRAVGVERNRVQRLLVIPPQQKSSAYNKAAELFAGMQIAVDHADALQPLREKLIEKTGKLPNSVFIVDPRGQIILGYPANSDPKDVLKDLQKLLKVSTIG